MSGQKGDLRRLPVPAVNSRHDISFCYVAPQIFFRVPVEKFLPGSVSYLQDRLVLKRGKVDDSMDPGRREEVIKIPFA